MEAEERRRRTHMKSSVHSSAYVWKSDAKDLRLSVHQLYECEMPFRFGAGPQLSEPCTKFEPLVVESRLEK
jgi:hypothetical protein